MQTSSEPRNPFYLLMLATGLIFIVTVLAYAVIPVIEDKALDAGTRPPPSPFREGLRSHGHIWILGELAVLVILGLLSMGLDRYRRWQQERQQPPSDATTKVESPPTG